eukprot:gb/GECH01005872.1/.p1 GENE.gb/GECH01005872.1/~~gb/GECH01005872.1/.p1  ORF type:complete len:109 (+),score=16.28 gb/GECH01005872.1/:1-327(+)
MLSPKIFSIVGFVLLGIPLFLSAFVEGGTPAINPEYEFLFDHGNAMFYLLSRRPSDRSSGNFQVAQLVHVVTGNTDTWYDAICLYRPGVKCMYFDGDSLRRPQSERTL